MLTHVQKATEKEYIYISFLLSLVQGNIERPQSLSPEVDGYGVVFKEDLEGKVLPIAS